jgi:hypothetical protein
MTAAVVNTITAAIMVAAADTRLMAAGTLLTTVDHHLLAVAIRPVMDIRPAAEAADNNMVAAATTIMATDPRWC